jgi:hypothetical protein
VLSVHSTYREFGASGWRKLLDEVASAMEMRCGWAGDKVNMLNLLGPTLSTVSVGGLKRSAKQWQDKGAYV